MDDPTKTNINDDGEERVCVRGTSLAFFWAVITCHGTMTLLTTTSVLDVLTPLPDCRQESVEKMERRISGGSYLY